MNAKKLYKAHLDKLINKDIYYSPKQLDGLKYEATINAINEAMREKLTW